jgi:Phosphotransferase enzyme family
MRIHKTPSARIGTSYGFASEIYRVFPEDSDFPASVVLKEWATDGIAGTREISFYQEFGDDSGIRIPKCYRASLDAENRRAVLILEDLAAFEQGDCLQPLDLERASVLARSLARFHLRWWDHERLRNTAWIPSVSQVWRGTDWFTSRRDLFLSRFQDRLLPACRPLFESIEAVERSSNKLLSGLPETLLHGDLHLDNVMFEGSAHPVILDWARVCRGPAALDLCELVFGMVGVDKINAILTAYASEFDKNDLGVSYETTVAAGLTGALFRKFITSTCGIARWNPASDREQKLIEAAISGVQTSILAWRERDPIGFSLTHI